MAVKIYRQSLDSPSHSKIGFLFCRNNFNSIKLFFLHLFIFSSSILYLNSFIFRIPSKLCFAFVTPCGVVWHGGGWFNIAKICALLLYIYYGCAVHSIFGFHLLCLFHGILLHSWVWF